MLFETEKNDDRATNEKRGNSDRIEKSVPFEEGYSRTKCEKRENDVEFLKKGFEKSKTVGKRAI